METVDRYYQGEKLIEFFIYNDHPCQITQRPLEFGKKTIGGVEVFESTEYLGYLQINPYKELGGMKHSPLFAVAAAGGVSYGPDDQGWIGIGHELMFQKNAIKTDIMALAAKMDSFYL